ncbi:PadR family transcriptional regulator [Clostridium estertheticum]|uniref:PadR family transcriptional regulator n=1 Tax=Clostridium estertheticum TaxID=238834 RepID=UPI0027152775|nr:PadR family transcriptional regulator [Clostridium estertheticum]WLC82113.1 PadR family transcriptional regulator [Clostridium estertheticum]
MSNVTREIKENFKLSKNLTEENGFLDSIKKESAFGPKRKYYSLSSLGKKELKNFYDNWEELRDSIDSIFKDYEEGKYE